MNISTIEVQKLIAKRRGEILERRKGKTREQILDEVNRTVWK